MGVTIHYEGRLRDAGALGRVVSAAQRFAEAAGWATQVISEPFAQLSRVRDEEPWDYLGPTTGLTLYPHESCEPVRLEFDKNGYVQEFVKTQYAPPEIHVQVVELLRLIAREFDPLAVEDEGEYWDTSDVGVLLKHVEACDRALAAILREESGTRGPVRLSNGRIADYLSDE